MFLRFSRRTRIAELEKGREAVVEGRVVADRLLALPGSGTKCVYYELLKEVFRRGDRGAGRKLWMPDSAEQKLAGFYVEDETGKVWVAAEGEEVEVGGASAEAGPIGTKGRARYSARYVPAGVVLRLRGLVDAHKRGEPNDTLVLRPRAKGRLQVLVRGQAAQ